MEVALLMCCTHPLMKDRRSRTTQTSAVTHGGQRSLCHHPQSFRLLMHQIISIHPFSVTDTCSD